MAGQVIINEFLTFVQNKIDVLDELSIVQICATNFLDAEIEAGKSTLYSACGDKVRIVQRKGDDKKKRNIKDVIKLLKEVDPDAQPTFVAKDLNRLPPVSFDYVDVTRLLKDMTTMKTELSEFQMRMSTEIVDLRNSFEQQTFKCKEVGPLHISPDKTKSLPLTPEPYAKKTCPTKPVETMYTPTYRDIVHKAPRSRRAKTTRIHSGQTDGDRVLVDSRLKLKSNEVVKGQLPVCDDDFTLVMNKKRKHKINNLRGTLESFGKIRVVESQCSIYVSRVMKSVTEADINDHITDRGEQCSKVELLKQFQETSFNSFKVTIPTSKLETFLNPNFWPAGLVYRRYRERRFPTVFK
ncbi:uncharacterized protein LOC120633403 [Pararge aegeria]|uniref:uncharacterized protein LOC120633403 n=1 Tax=Pararge aegeria TaxID=116150 RepID=UPI0019D151D1|nr:uncharacterized protein LOC120633403 [Pararge aegeria]